jgi:hypothetical protein
MLCNLYSLQRGSRPPAVAVTKEAETYMSKPSRARTGPPQSAQQVIHDHDDQALTPLFFG